MRATVLYLLAHSKQHVVVLGPLFRLGLIAEHGYWVKPAAAHRRQSERERANAGWAEGTNGKPPDQFAGSREWGTERGGREGRIGERRETTVGNHQSASHKHRSHRRSRAGPGAGPPSPDGSSRQQPSDGRKQPRSGAEWILRSHNADLSWRSEVLAILENFTGRTPGSFLELKDR